MISISLGKLLGLDDDVLEYVNRSQLRTALDPLYKILVDDPRTPERLNAISAGLQQLRFDTETSNLWKECRDAPSFLNIFTRICLEWCDMIPHPSIPRRQELFWIEVMDWLFISNRGAVLAARGQDPLNPDRPYPPFREFFVRLASARANFLSMAESRSSIDEWISDPRTEITDYEKQSASDYASWNDFFERRLRQSETSNALINRPVVNPGAPFLVSAPTDCIIRPLDVLPGSGKTHAPADRGMLSSDTQINVKGKPVAFQHLLGNAPPEIKESFSGGQGFACVLTPNGYHHFHSPVDGTVRYLQHIQCQSFGLDQPLAHSLHTSSQGPRDVDFSGLDWFNRAVVIISLPDSTERRPRLVASVAVGLNTIGSVVLDRDVRVGCSVERGTTRLGNFAYGGSLNLIFFSKDLLEPGLRVRLGAQIGRLTS